MAFCVEISGMLKDLYYVSVVVKKVNLRTYLSARAAGTVQRSYRVPSTGQVKEQAGFLVSRSPTLPSSTLNGRRYF